MIFYKWTVRFIVAGIAVITAYDVWALAGGYERTISWTLGAAAYQWPAIPFLFGFLAGHLFFANKAAGGAPAPVIPIGIVPRPPAVSPAAIDRIVCEWTLGHNAALTPEQLNSLVDVICAAVAGPVAAPATSKPLGFPTCVVAGCNNDAVRGDLFCGVHDGGPTS